MLTIKQAIANSPKKERRIARILYACIVAAVAFGIVFLLIIGQNDSLNPFSSSDPNNREAPSQLSSPEENPPNEAIPQ